MRRTSMTAESTRGPGRPSAGAGTLFAPENSSGAGARALGRPFREGRSDLGHDTAGIPEHVGGGEPQRRVTRVAEPVLRAVVLGHGVLVRFTVVLDDQPRVPIEEIGPRQELTIGRVQLYLDLGRRESRFDKQDPQPALHR